LRTQREGIIQKIGSKPLPDTTMTLNFPASRTESKFLLFISHSAYRFCFSSLNGLRRRDLIGFCPMTKYTKHGVLYDFWCSLKILSKLYFLQFKNVFCKHPKLIQKCRCENSSPPNSAGPIYIPRVNFSLPDDAHFNIPSLQTLFQVTKMR
jgi:hypothetical protein